MLRTSTSPTKMKMSTDVYKRQAHGHGAHPAVTDVLLDFQHQGLALSVNCIVHFQRIEQGRKRFSQMCIRDSPGTWTRCFEWLPWKDGGSPSSAGNNLPPWFPRRRRNPWRRPFRWLPRSAGCALSLIHISMCIRDSCRTSSTSSGGA